MVDEYEIHTLGAHDAHPLDADMFGAVQYRLVPREVGIQGSQ